MLPAWMIWRSAVFRKAFLVARGLRIAKKLGARHTVARIRSPEYYREANLLKKEVGLNMIINPEHAAAQEISRLLRVPSAFSVETFARGLVPGARSARWGRWPPRPG